MKKKIVKMLKVGANSNNERNIRFGIVNQSNQIQPGKTANELEIVER